MPYNSSHTGPQIDAAVELLGQIQEARESTKADRVEVKKLAGEVKVNAEQVATQAAIVNSQAAHVSSDALTVANGRDEAVAAASAAEDSKDAAALSQSAAEQSQAAASASEKSAAESQLAAGLSEQVSAGHAADATAAAQQVAIDAEAASTSARDAARSAQNAEAVVTGGTASTTPRPGLIPLANAQGKIDAGWVPDDIARRDAVEFAAGIAADAADAAAEAMSRTENFLFPSPESPSFRDNGLPLQIGDRYFNTVQEVEYLYKLEGWVPNDSLEAIEKFESDLSQGSNPLKGAALVGYESGSVKEVFDSTKPFGPLDQRVDQFAGSNTNPGLGGPFIKRLWATTKPIILFVDPAIGLDTNLGTIAAPLRTITAALQKVPQNIYHKVRIYLLDGDYGNENIKVFNHYVSARGTAGFRIIGHIANYDGDTHPIYKDDNPDAVILGGNEHVISGIAGTEEFAIAGVTIKDGWIENYDTVTVLYRSKFTGGHISPGYSTHHALGGHASKVKCIYVDFDKVASVGSFSDFVDVLFEQCTLGELTSNSDHYVNGVPFQVGDNCRVVCKNSPTLLKKGPNGKAIVNAAGQAYDADYSALGYSIIRRSSPARDERIAIVAHDGTQLDNNRGAGAEFSGEQHPLTPGRATIGFGPSAAARAYVRYCGAAAAGGPKNVAEFTPLGDVKAYAALSFGTNGSAISSLLNDGQGAMWVHTNGDVRIAVKMAGVTKWAKVFDYAAATPF